MGMLELAIELVSTGDAPPLTITRDTYIRAFTTAVTHVTPNGSCDSGIPLPSLLAIVVRGNETDLRLQLSSHLNGKLVCSYRLFVVGIDITEIDGLVGVRTTRGNEVEHTTGSTTGKFELRTISLYIIDIDTRYIGNVILNPVAISLRRGAGLVSVLRELCAVKQVTAGIAVNVHRAVFLNRITGREHTQRYCEQ